jgi:hypothetical protein
MRVGNEVGKPRDYQFAGTLDAARPSDAWMVGEQRNLLDDPKHGFGRCGWVLLTYVLMNQPQVAACVGRPFQ